MRLLTLSLAAMALSGALVAGMAPAAAATTENRTTITVTRSGTGQATAVCPAGHHVTGGGIEVAHYDELNVIRSRPTVDGRGWEGGAWGEVDKDGGKEGKSGKNGKRPSRTDDEPQGLPVTVYAMCVRD